MGGVGGELENDRSSSVEPDCLASPIRLTASAPPLAPFCALMPKIISPRLSEMFRRPLPNGSSRSCFDRLSNRLTKILTEARKLRTT